MMNCSRLPGGAACARHVHARVRAAHVGGERDLEARARHVQLVGVERAFTRFQLPSRDRNLADVEVGDRRRPTLDLGELRLRRKLDDRLAQLAFGGSAPAARRRPAQPHTDQ
jgi:hypothetical protein